MRRSLLNIALHWFLCGAVALYHLTQVVSGKGVHLSSGAQTVNSCSCCTDAPNACTEAGIEAIQYQLDEMPKSKQRSGDEALDLHPGGCRVATCGCGALRMSANAPMIAMNVR